ncbi:hypothetical protein POTOM_008242 [Populus tomentosa]|uniref:Lactate/malate dehydrogenase C-terminal domain-containing protein n=1 Tax=Populus tomentosa TaxID=118781 RepID=A0A8X8DC69_POPTO|nr:hypothetical protein POTOM_008242 [Populus tomentosa]
MSDISPAAAVKCLASVYCICGSIGILATTDVNEACKGVNIAVMVGGFPCKEGMERRDILVVANPANTNALILKEFAPSIPVKNITCLTRLDHNRALSHISGRLNVDVRDVKNVIIWGNHSSTQYPDANYATATTDSGEKSVRELVADDHWIDSEYINSVRERGSEIIKARKLSSALSAASAACDHVHDWIIGTAKGTWVSMGVYSDGSYGIQPDIIYSFPVTCQKGEWSIVQGLKINEFSREKMDTSMKELTREGSLAYSCLNQT